MAISPSRQRPACAALAEHHTKIEDRHVRELFAEDPDRGEWCSLRRPDCIWIAPNDLLVRLAAQCDLEERRVMMLAGKPTTFPARSSLN
jgi:glucose-6-phosphate isomerase